MERYTQEGLPVLSENTMNAFARDFNTRMVGEDYESWATKKFEQIRRENPLVWKFMTRNVGSFETRGEKSAYIMGVTLLYHLLRIQAEANKLEEQVNGI